MYHIDVKIRRVRKYIPFIVIYNMKYEVLNIISHQVSQTGVRKGTVSLMKGKHVIKLLKCKIVINHFKITM